MKFTPRPWKSSFYQPCGRCVIPVVDANAQTPESIAVCYGPDATDNANLIAAAPDLLAALEEMVLRCDMFPDAYYIKDAKAAIAKAKGGLK